MRRFVRLLLPLVCLSCAKPMPVVLAESPPPYLVDFCAAEYDSLLACFDSISGRDWVAYRRGNDVWQVDLAGAASDGHLRIGDEAVLYVSVMLVKFQKRGDGAQVSIRPKPGVVVVGQEPGLFSAHNPRTKPAWSPWPSYQMFERVKACPDFKLVACESLPADSR